MKMLTRMRIIFKALVTRRPAASGNLRASCSVVDVDKFEDICLRNEPILLYERDSQEREKLESELKNILTNVEEVPLVIDGKEMISDNVRYQNIPHKHSQRIAKFYYADDECIKAAIRASVKAQQWWDETPFKERMDIWERAADLMATEYRAQLVAATMLGQSKTIVQAEIDAAAELIDFIRMNVGFLKETLNYQPLSPTPAVYKNFLRLRGLEGFVAAISPFNFTAIGGNLAYTPALMGNGVVWKPSDSAILSNWIVFKIMREAGVPDGVVNFVPADGPTFGRVCSNSKHLAGVNFTGSVPTFINILRTVTGRIEHYLTFPRMIGECGGKNFHFVHSSANSSAVVATTIRAAFEYSGQKCSACSRLYVPESIWESALKKPLIEKTNKLKVGDVRDYKNFLSSVIDEVAFQRIVKYIEHGKHSNSCSVLAGGKYSNLHGYMIEPTIIEVSKHDDRLLMEEIFGPVLAVYVYKDDDLDKTMDMINKESKYSLTGAIFGSDEKFLKSALSKFRRTAGNFYINDKCTGSVVGQQPFGGARLSGTNDKAGSLQYILRWTSPQSVKETYEPQTQIYYPYMDICGTEDAS